MIEPIKTDVLIVGSGSAGLCAATWLARLKVSFLVLEKRSGPLQIGQADGVQCRTVEVFESFGLSEDLVKHAYWVNEVCFWSVDDSSAECGENGHGFEEKGRIVRTGRTADVAEGLSWQPHVILNQAQLNGILIEDIKNHDPRDFSYGVSVTSVKVDESASEDPNDY